MEFIIDLITTGAYIITAASIISTYTPSEKDMTLEDISNVSTWVSKLYGYIDLIALNFKVKR
jgi:hypothetical protein